MNRTVTVIALCFLFAGIASMAGCEERQNRQPALTCLELPPRSGAKGDILILLHGYGSNEKDLLQLAPLLSDNLHFISTRAPLRLSPDRYGWFPIEFRQGEIIINREGARKAKKPLIDCIRHIIREHNPPQGKVLLMGFSQGADMSYLTALAEPSLLHGVIAVGGKFPEAATLLNRNPEVLREVPFLVIHGKYDDVIPVKNGRKSQRWLERHLDKLEYREYPMGHEINIDAVNMIRDWLRRSLDHSL